MNKIVGISIFLTFILIACTPIATEVLVTETPVQIPSAMPTLWIASPVVPTFFIGDGGLITGQPCAAPCFFGIHRGETRFDDVVSILDNSGISPCVKDDDHVSCGYDIYVGTHSPTFVVDGVGYYPSISVTLEDIIQKYGNPDLMHVIPTSIPEAPTISLLLFWDSIRMRIRLPETYEQYYVLEQSTEIEDVNYFDETLYAYLKDNVYSQLWGGYNSYQPANR